MEEVILETKAKPVIVKVQATILLLAYTGVCIFALFSEGTITTQGIVNFIMSLIIWGLMLIPFIGIFYSLIHSRYIITTEKVIVKTKGVFSRQEKEMTYRKVENVTFTTNVVSEYFGYGTVIMSGTGGSKMALWGVGEPAKITKIITDLVMEYNKKEKEKNKND
jgi:uncharacterized membrane protein YdbT with pleckstrin-like domain